MVLILLLLQGAASTGAAALRRSRSSVEDFAVRNSLTPEMQQAALDSGISMHDLMESMMNGIQLQVGKVQEGHDEHLAELNARIEKLTKEAHTAMIGEDDEAAVAASQALVQAEEEKKRYLDGHPVYDQEKLKDICIDLHGLEQMRSYLDEKQKQLLPKVELAADNEEEDVEENEEDAMAVPEKLVLYLDAKAKADHCYALVHGTQLSIKQEELQLHAIQVKENSTRNHKALWEGNVSKTRYTRKIQKHWQYLFDLEENMYEHVSKEIEDNEEGAPVMEETCNREKLAYQTAYANYGALQQKMKNTREPLVQAEVELDAIMHDVMQLQIKQWRAYDAQQKLKVVLLENVTTGTAVCPDAENLGGPRSQPPLTPVSLSEKTESDVAVGAMSAASSAMTMASASGGALTTTWVPT